MRKKKINFKDWLALSTEEQAAVSRDWDKYRGEGRNIVEQACELFKRKLKQYKDIINISYGVYHGGDWIISITLRVGHKIKIPHMFCGIRVVTLYKGLNYQLKYKLIHKYENNIERFVDGEIRQFGKYFNFTDSPSAKQWLVEFVKETCGEI